MSDNPNSVNTPRSIDDEPRHRRASRYQKIQARREAQKRNDQRFYNGMFALMGFTALLAILLGAIGINGFGVDTTNMAGWTTPWLGPLSKMEVAGLGLVGLIALSVYLKMRKRG